MDKDAYYATSLIHEVEKQQPNCIAQLKKCMAMCVAMCCSFYVHAAPLNEWMGWLTEKVPKSLSTPFKSQLSIDRKSMGFQGRESVLAERGIGRIEHIQYGQVHLKSAKDPLFLMVAGRETLVRIVVRGAAAGLRAPTLRFIMDHEQKGRLVDMALMAQGALPVEQEADSPDFSTTPVNRAYLALIPAKNLAPGRYRVWISGGYPSAVSVPAYQEIIDVKPFYAMPITVMPFQWRDSAPPDMSQQSIKLYQQVFERYFPFIQPQVRIRPFPVLSAMSEADFSDQQFHVDGTAMMIMDRARKGLYIGVYNKKHRNMLAGERVGTSSGSLLMVQDQLGDTQSDVIAHEIGHSLGLKHVDCGHPEPPIQEKFPYPNGGVGTAWGLDWHTDPSKIRLIDPRGTKDLMSYCFESRFISDHNYFFAQKTWINYRARNHLALLGDIYALQIFAYPPAGQLEVHGIGDLVDTFESKESKSDYTFELIDGVSGKVERIPVFIKNLGAGQEAYVARTSAIGWLDIDRIRLIDPTGQIIMDNHPTLNYLNRDKPAPLTWMRQGDWLSLRFDAQKYDKGIVLYQAKSGVVATLSFLDKRGVQNVALRGLPPDGYFWAVLASRQPDPYGRKVIATIRQPWANVFSAGTRKLK